MVRGVVVCDLLTLWVVVMAVRSRLSVALVVALVSAVLVETHTVVPLGLYLCGYWVVLMTVHLLRGVVAWNMGVSWVVTIVLSEVWLIGLETVAIDLSWENLPMYMTRCVVRVVGTSAVGLIMLRGGKLWRRMGGRSFAKFQ